MGTPTDAPRRASDPSRKLVGQHACLGADVLTGVDLSEAERIVVVVKGLVGGSGSRIDSLLVAHDLYDPTMRTMSKEARLSRGLDLARRQGKLMEVLAHAEQTLAVMATASQKETRTVSARSGSKIFISHATADLPLVEALVGLLRLGSDATREDLVCTSLEGMRPPAGVRFIDWIKSQLVGAGLVIEVITPAYWESQFCVCELGAQWGLGLEAHPLLAPGIHYADLKAVLSGVQAGKLDDASDLDELHDRVGQVVGRKQSTANWSKQRTKFLKSLPRLMKNIPPNLTVPVADYTALAGELESVSADLAKREDEVARLKEALAAAMAGVSRSEIAATLSTDNDSAFESLVSAARTAQYSLPSIVRKVMWQTFGSRDGGGYRPEREEWDDIQREIDNARLRAGSEEDLVYLEDEDDGVREAIEAVEALLEAEVPDGYAETFRAEYGMKFNLANRRVWVELDLL